MELAFQMDDTISIRLSDDKVFWILTFLYHKLN